jgi:aerobic carbon-monoxide dehydrogenase large subunit
MQPVKFGIGQAVTRLEDESLLRGAGRYVADHAPSGLLHAVVLRSPHAHARFTITDARKARAMPGVALVLTGAETAQLGHLPCQGLVPGTDIEVPPYPVLARDEVRHVGDAVAFVVADTLAHATDAAEAIVVDWQPLRHVIGAAAALVAGAAPVWPQGNLVFDVSLGDAAATARAFAIATHKVVLELVNQRLAANYIDTRGVVAECDPDSGRLTLTLSSQGSHSVRAILCNDILRIAPDQMRVVTPDVGGGFGTKLFCYREYALAAVAAQRLSRPVKWIADRNEHFLADAHGRDNITRARLALDPKGRFLGLEIDLIADMGAYLSCYGPFIPYLGAGMSPGVYDIAACRVRVRGAYTNTVPVDAYRGAGRPEASYVIERLVDVAARELDLAPDVLRRKNFIKPAAMPYATATGKAYDGGDFAGHLTRAQVVADWKGFGHRLRDARRRGRLRGIGLATYIEACGGDGPETANVRLDPDGGISVLIGTQSTGQGHHTAYAQLIAERLRLSPAHVRVVQGDTDLIATGAGTGGSCSIPVGGVAVARAAAQLADRLKALAGNVLEAAAGDLEFDDGAIRVVGTDRAISLADLAQHARPGAEPLAGANAFMPSAATYPNGTHLAEVEIDPDTGGVELIAYVVVDDFGVTLNPLLLAAQVHGGAVQGIGQALMEDMVYDVQSGQPMSASLLDYALPRADEIPAFVFETRNVPCATNPLGVKGAGEAGAVGSCPAVMNAIADALWRAHRIRHVDMPATPQKLWAAIAEGRRVHTL